MILALVCEVSVMIPAWLPVRDTASAPSSARAMHMSDMDIRSPALTSMSYSRGGGDLLTPRARSISSSVVLPIALTTTTTESPDRLVRATCSATDRMRSAPAREVPPNFWTRRATGEEATSGRRWGSTSQVGACVRSLALAFQRVGPRQQSLVIQDTSGPRIGFRPVPSEKRARQRAGRDARRAAMARQQKRRKLARRVIIGVVFVGVLFGSIYLATR